MKISLICTVLNEEKTVGRFLDSVFSQTRKPDEIIIVDGGSSDQTVAKVKSEKLKVKNYDGRFRIITKRGNRAVGRNEAVRQASNDIIVCSDAGCILDKNWVKKIVEPFSDSKTDVVAGYYKGKAKSLFQKCLVPYVLVMPDKVDSQNFPPATRSVAFRKKVWKKVNGFPENFSHNEDYVFAEKLRQIGARIVFAKDAIVYWVPRKNLREAFIMFFRFAFGDAQSGIFRPKATFLILRYLFGFYLLFLTFLFKSVILVLVIVLLLVGYISWSIWKNYRYVKRLRAVVILPVLQITSDIAVVLGTGLGLLSRISLKSIYQATLRNKGVAFIIFIYIALTLRVLNWGIPGQSHPFPYHMDEWHQLQAVRATFQFGTPNVPGAAHGTMFQFVLSGFYLIPFVIFKIVDPFAIASAVGSLTIQERLFEILRLNTLIFGVLSILVLAKIAKDYFKLNPVIPVFLFTITPVWLILSNYFKYDIALMFWILLSILSMIRLIKSPTFGNFLLAGLPCALAVATKISALPILLSYILSFFLFMEKPLSQIRVLFAGLFIFISIFLLTGVPDFIFGKGNIVDHLRDNIIDTPKQTLNLNLGQPYAFFTYVRQYQTIFGHGFYILSISAIIYMVLGLPQKVKTHLFLFLSFCFFALSLLPLGILAGGNRALILLPFLALMVGIFLNVLQKNWLLRGIIIFLLAVQAIESYSWIQMKLSKSPQELSSEWIIKNVSVGTTIGLENIPIYQSIPDLILKEFYEMQYDPKKQTRYLYEVIDAKTKLLPNLIVITNSTLAGKYEKKSAKKSLLLRLRNEGYEEIAYFTPDFKIFRFFGKESDYLFNPLVASPSKISIVKKIMPANW